MILTLLDNGHLLGSEESLDLLQSRAMNHSGLVVLLLGVQAGIILNGRSLIRFGDQNGGNLILLTLA